MFCKFTVPVPVVAGKISHQTTKSGTYILYVLSRQYDPAKKHTVPVRAMIGKMSDEEGKMFPNEKFFVEGSVKRNSKILKFCPIRSVSFQFRSVFF